MTIIWIVRPEKYSQLEHSYLPLWPSPPFPKPGPDPDFTICCLDFKQYVYFYLTQEWHSRETKCLWLKQLSENLEGKHPQMQMEEAHTCSSAVIAGRLDLLRNWDADNRFPRKTRSVEPTNLQVPLRRHSGIIFSTIWLPLISILPEKPSQFHKSKLPENSNSIHLRSILLPWPPEGGAGIAWSHYRKVRCSSNHSETVKEVLPIRKPNHKSMCSKCRPISMSQVLGKHLGMPVKGNCLLRSWHLVWVIIGFPGSFSHITPE